MPPTANVERLTDFRLLECAVNGDVSESGGPSSDDDDDEEISLSKLTRNPFNASLRAFL